MDTPLSVELEIAALRQLQLEYAGLNHSLFGLRLRPPALVLSDVLGRLGCWRAEGRTIELSRAALRSEPWTVLVEVLKHEMAHQFVDEVLQARAQAAHGPAFQQVCAQRGIDPRAQGTPQPGATPSREAAILERIAKLLALAESPNEHEAQSAMNTAQRLMLKHNLSSVAAREARGYTFRHLGQPAGRVDEAQRWLATILHEHFFVEVVWVPSWRVNEGRKGTVLEVCGTPENVELACYVHDFLQHTADRLWAEHRRARGIERNRDRRAYRAGVMVGFREKLESQRATHREQGLVWVGDPGLSAYYRARFPRLVTTRGRSSSRTEAHGQGRQAGRAVVLHKGVSTSGGSGPGGRLLGPRRG